jgi:sec-independent protein translocase protein TatC
MTEKSYLEHLNSLRNVLLRSLSAIALIFFVLVFFRNEIFLIFANPLTEILPANSSMIATGVVSPFLTPLRLTFYVATFVAIPYLLFELWNFIAPGLYKEEKMGFFAVLFSSIVLFLAGICFAFFVIFPLIFTFFVQASPSEVLVMTDINEYIDFVVRILFVFGFAFEVPIVLMLMIWSGVTNTQQLSSARPYVIIGCFVVGMFLTPPDIFSQTLLALPVWLLYEVGLLASRFFIKK